MIGVQSSAPASAVISHGPLFVLLQIAPHKHQPNDFHSSSNNVQEGEVNLTQL